MASSPPGSVSRAEIWDDAEFWLRQAVADNLASEEYFYVLLWQGHYTAARDHARRVLESLGQNTSLRAIWLEHQGDTLFFERNYAAAGQSYEDALKSNARSTSAYLKLADVWFQLGDAGKERKYREGIYGFLR